MSYLTYQNSLTSNISLTPSTYHSSSHIYLPMMRCFQPQNWTNQAQLKVTDSKLNKSYNSDANLKRCNLNMKLNGKVMNTMTIAGSMLKILMRSSTETTGFMVTRHIPTSSENQENPHKEDLQEKKHSHKFMKKASDSWQESALTMRSQNSLHKLCFPLILMIMLTEVQDTSDSCPEREGTCISICNFPAHYFKKAECKEVSYRVYSFVTTLQGYPDILPCDLSKHISW